MGGVSNLSSASMWPALEHMGMHVISDASGLGSLGDDPRHHIRADGRHVR
jgi:hypothetical protein